MSETEYLRLPRRATFRELPPSKSALSRSKMLDAASQFLEMHPFRDLTVSGLMAQTGLSRSSFYQYFKDLYELVETLLDEVKGEIIEGAQPWLSGEGETVKSLQQSLEGLVDVAHEHGHILRAVADAAASDERLEYVWETFLSAFDEIVSARISKDQVAGRTPQFDPLPVARALNRMNAGLLINAFGRIPKHPKTEVSSAILRIWLATLYPEDAASATGPKQT